jgi:hypothetical protein
MAFSAGHQAYALTSKKESFGRASLGYVIVGCEKTTDARSIKKN